MYLVLKDLSFRKEESGDDGVVDTPVPIPNTEVKHHSGDDSVSKSSTLPVLFFYSPDPLWVIFYFILNFNIPKEIPYFFYFIYS